jgi:hypothetical protein
MKTLSKILLCAVLFLHTSFKSNQIQKDSSFAFKSFLAKFKVLQPPLNIDPFKINIRSCIKLTKTDNLFVRSESPDEIYAYGLLPDTSNSYKLIWLEPSEVQMPYLATFTKNGKFIKKEFLGVGQCGSDCCYECKESIKINQNLTILSVDSITSCKCDANGPIKGTTEKFILLKKGRVMKDGNITMGAILKRPANKTK